MSSQYWVTHTCIYPSGEEGFRSFVCGFENELPTAKELADIVKNDGQIIFMQKLHKE